MTGPLTVPFAVAALFTSSNETKVLFAALSGACLMFSAYWVWRTERVQSLKSQQALAELFEKPWLSFAVHGIPACHRFGENLLFLVPDVTIVNQSSTKKACIRVSLWIALEGGGQAYCPPEGQPVADWEASHHSYRNRALIFPLNLDPAHVVSGYIAFSGHIFRGGPAAAWHRDDSNPELRYLAGRVKFTDFQSVPPATVFHQEIKYYIFREAG